jgi:hypothetical protein
MVISLIIPARNDSEALARTLDHLDTVAGRNAIEVIVAVAGPQGDARRAIAGRARLLAPGSSTRAALMSEAGRGAR